MTKLLSGMMLKGRLLILLIILSLFWSSTLAACPLVDGLVDYNCDGVVKIAVTGDSVVKGVGDAPRNWGGYVLRMQLDFPDAKIENLGVSGVSSGQLFRAFRKQWNKPSAGATKRKLRDSDMVIIDVGRNDYWRQESPSKTVRNIKRLTKFFRSAIYADSGTEPFVAISTLIPTSREFQAPFITSLNILLLKRNSQALPVLVRFDTLGTEILSYDGLHPSAVGYDTITSVAEDALTEVIAPRVLRRRSDSDADGIFDLFETSKFKTDPTVADSDGDGMSDGDEVFINLTDPLDPLSF